MGVANALGDLRSLNVNISWIDLQPLVIVAVLYLTVGVACYLNWRSRRRRRRETLQALNAVMSHLEQPADWCDDACATMPLDLSALPLEEPTARRRVRRRAYRRSRDEVLVSRASAWETQEVAG